MSNVIKFIYLLIITSTTAAVLFSHILVTWLPLIFQTELPVDPSHCKVLAYVSSLLYSAFVPLDIWISTDIMTGTDTPGISCIYDYLCNCIIPCTFWMFKLLR